MDICDLSQELFKELAPYCSLVNTKARLDCCSEEIFFVDKGFAIVFNDDKIFSISKAGEFIGLHNLFDYRRNPLHLSVANLFPDSRLFFIKREQAQRVIEDRNLYKKVAILFHSRLYDMCNYLKYITSGDAYVKIRPLILLYIEYQDILKKITPMPNFIINISGISRSRIMSILQEIRKGNYILRDAEGNYILQKTLPLFFK